MIAELKVNYDETVFELPEREIVKKAIETGQFEHISAMLMEVTPKKAAEIEKIQQQLRPRDFQFQSKAQQDFEKWMAANGNEISPEIEAEWQRKIDAEREEALRSLTGGVSEASITKIDDQLGSSIQLSNNLNSVKGLGEKSVQRLQSAGINSVDQLRALSQEERIKILGPLVADKIKHLTS